MTSLPARFHKYKPFAKHAQLRHLLVSVLARWLLTAAIIGAIYGVLVAYSDREAMRKSRKGEFNAIIIALSISLSLNLASSLKDMASTLRWWALSVRDWPVAEADLLLQSEHLSQLVKLASVTKLWSVRMTVIAWAFVNLAAQGAVATLGVTYSVETADTVTVTRPGIVSIPDLSNIQTKKVLSSPSQSFGALRYTANSYGLIALGYEWGTPEDVPKPGTIFYSDDPLIFCDARSCAYTFYEASVDNKTEYTAVATNRSVATSASCKSWRVLGGGDGSKSSITIDDDSQTRVTIPAINGDSQSTFMVDMVNGIDIASASITVFEASKKDPWYYQCSVRVGAVQNSVLPVHRLGENVTSLAASAIALQGYGASRQSNSDLSSIRIQFQSYPAESTYGEPQRGNTSRMATLLSGFATGVIAVTAQANSNIQARGLTPLRGVRLKISNWTYVHIILGLILGIMLFLGVVSTVLANKAPVRKHSPLRMASMLRPVSRKMSFQRCHGSHEKDDILQENGPTLRYQQARTGEYYFETNCEESSPL